MGFPAEYLNAGQRSPLACADGYQFQRADGRDGRPQDNACGAIGGCVNQVDVSGQVCGQQCNDQCRRQFDNPQNTNIAYPNPTRLDGRLELGPAQGPHPAAHLRYVSVSQRLPRYAAPYSLSISEPCHN